MTTKLSRNVQKRRTALDQVNHLAWLLDNSIRIPIINYRIGLDALIGVIPGLGDVAGLLLSSFIVIQASRLGAPRATLLRMVLNVVIEMIIGLIPVLGDLFDATFKANVRNVRLLAQVVDPQRADDIPDSYAGKGVSAALISLVLGAVILVGGVGVALFWR